MRGKIHNSQNDVSIKQRVTTIYDKRVQNMALIYAKTVPVLKWTKKTRASARGNLETGEVRRKTGDGRRKTGEVRPPPPTGKAKKKTAICVCADSGVSIFVFLEVKREDCFFYDPIPRKIRPAKTINIVTWMPITHRNVARRS